MRSKITIEQKKRNAGKLHVPFEWRTEASPSMGASSDPTPLKPGNAGGGDLVATAAISPRPVPLPTPRRGREGLVWSGCVTNDVLASRKAS